MAKKLVTKKQKIILTYILIFRFLNSKQIQKFLNHKDYRRINAWLKDLTDKGYIERDFKPIFGVLTKPAVYSLTSIGRAYLKRNYNYHFPKYIERISRDNKASKGFRIKCQVLADWYLSMFPSGGKRKYSILDNLIEQLSTDTDNTEDIIPINTLQFFTPSYFPEFALLEPIKPDAYMRERTTKGVVHALMFVLDAYIPRLILRYFLQRLFTAIEEEWETDDVISLQVYILAPNNMVITYLRRALPAFLERCYCSKEVMFHFGTRNQMYKQLQDPEQEIKWRTMSTNEEYD